MFLTKPKMTAVVGALATVIGMGVVLWAGRPATADAPDRTREDAAQPNTRIALLNLTYVITNSDESKELRESVKKRVTFYEDRAKVSHSRIETWRQELAAPGLAAEKKDALEMDIRAEQRKIQDDQEEAKRKLAQISDEQTVALYKKIRDVAARYAVAHNFDLVLSYNDATDEKDLSSAANVSRKFQVGACMPLYWKPEMDISKQVVSAMNNARHAPRAPSGDTAPTGN
jgi:Skp family chaperone for outer membrane proteins